jgi:hypothetical protein
MNIDESLKTNLIADVENICEINLDEETKISLKRAFEITLGCYKEYSPADLTVMSLAEKLKEKGVIVVVGNGHDLINTSKDVQGLKKDRTFEIEPSPMMKMPFVEKKPKGHIRPYKYHK